MCNIVFHFIMLLLYVTHFFLYLTSDNEFAIENRLLSRSRVLIGVTAAVTAILLLIVGGVLSTPNG